VPAPVPMNQPANAPRAIGRRATGDLSGTIR